MAEPGSFLERWSKRKRAAAAPAVEQAAAERPPSPVVMPDASDGGEPGTASAEYAAAEPEIEADALPPLESIGAGGDVRAFLRKGVPAALRRAALRRLWATDPRISGFREVADYDWDFNAPGYGALLPGDDPRALAAQLMGATRRVLDAPPSPTADSTFASDDPPTADSTSVRGALGPTADPTVAAPVRDGPRAPPDPIEPPTAHSTLPPAGTESVARGDRGAGDAGDVRAIGRFDDGAVAAVSPSPGGAADGDACSGRRRRRHGGAVPI